MKTERLEVATADMANALRRVLGVLWEGTGPAPRLEGSGEEGQLLVTGTDEGRRWARQVARQLAGEPRAVQVSLTIEQGGSVVARPRLDTLEGQPAEIHIGDSQGQALNVKVRPTRLADARTDLTVDVESWQDTEEGKVTHQVSRFRIRLDEEAGGRARAEAQVSAGELRVALEADRT